MIGKSDQPIKRYIIHALMIVLGLIAVVPIYVMLINSVRSSEQINSGLTIIFERNSFRGIITDNLAETRARDHARGIARRENFSQAAVSYFTENGQNRMLYLPADAEISVESEYDEEEPEVVDVRAPRIAVYTEDGELIHAYYFEPGLYTDIVEDGAAVRSDYVLFRRFLAVADRTGRARYTGLVPGLTVIEGTDKDGNSFRHINEYLAVMNDADRTHNGRVQNPRLSIVDNENNVLRTYALTSGLFLNIAEGQVVRPGTVLFDRIKRPPNIVYNWRALISRGFRMFRGFSNSAIIAISSTILVVYFSALTAYGLHVYKFRGRLAMWALILVIMMLPGSLTFIGFYQLMANWKLTDSYIPLILPGIAAAGAVLFIRQYMMSVLSMELIDAARIDGAGEYMIFNIIILPIIIPALAAQAIFAFVGSWNNFLAPTVLLSNQDLFTLPLLVALLRGDIYRTETGGIYLGIAISLIPIIIFYSFMARFIISGLTMGGIKE